MNPQQQVGVTKDQTQFYTNSIDPRPDDRSIMQLKATFAKQLLVNSLDLSLSQQHYAVCVGTLKFQPTMVSKVVFTVYKEK